MTEYQVELEECTRVCFRGFLNQYHELVVLEADARTYTFTHTPAAGTKYRVVVSALNEGGARTYIWSEMYQF